MYMYVHVIYICMYDILVYLVQHKFVKGCCQWQIQEAPVLESLSNYLTQETEGTDCLVTISQSRLQWAWKQPIQDVNKTLT